MIEKLNLKTTSFVPDFVADSVPLSSSKRPSVATYSITSFEQEVNKSFSCQKYVKLFLKSFWSFITWPFRKIYDCIYPENDPFRTQWLNNADLFYYYLHLSLNYDFVGFGLSGKLNAIHPENIVPFLQDLPINKLKTPIPIAINIGNLHWTLLYIDPIKHTIEYYDSKEDFEDPAVIKFYLDQLKEIFDSRVNTPFQVELKIEESLQPDSYQCGVWLLYFLENRLKNSNINFNQLNRKKAQKMIAEFRKEVKKVIDQVKEEWSSYCAQFDEPNALDKKAHAGGGDPNFHYFQMAKEGYKEYHALHTDSAPAPSGS